MTTAATIARVLSERGYDFEIARIFALEAAERGRLTTSQTLTEAVQVVADMLSPNGIWSATARPPMARFGKPSGREMRSPTATTISHGSWLVT